MHITLLSSEKLPVPPILGGPIEHTIFDTVQAITSPRLTAISPWAEALEESQYTLGDPFYHVDIATEECQFKKVMRGTLPKKMKVPLEAHRFYYLSGVSDLLNQLDPDIVQVHNRPDYLSYLLKQFPNKRLILFMHQEPPPKSYHKIGMKALIPRIDRIIFVSHYLAQRFLALFPSAKPKVSVIHNSIDVDQWHPNLKQHLQTQNIKQKHHLKSGKTILFVGRTVPRKGLHCLLESMKRICSKMPEAKLLVVGSPFYGVNQKSHYLERLKKQTQKVSENIIFTGYVPHDQMPYFFAAADLTAVPSLASEGLPKTVMESLSMGVPVIASRIGGIPEMIADGVEGRLIKRAKNVSALADHTLRLLSENDNLQNMGKNARKKAVHHFANPLRLKRMKALYESLHEQKTIGKTHI